ncbi:hypothetical protein [Acidianus sp. HS-5]|uniref:Cas10/Cmr2 second palm domain-containing protein n=1 Tax=Acidianus sp. HS-5 TaxID=2886040 RepID=UPI001F1DBC67|nr:hypothetical protein [Acidianus sp. HS-5]BDC17511.1 phosphohydrolase [Acidianus sp. HS-5]
MIRGVYGILVKDKDDGITKEEDNRKAREELRNLIIRFMLASKTDDVDLLTDYLSLIIKAPLLLPYIPYSGNSLLNNFDFLTSYIVTRRTKYVESGKELIDSGKLSPMDFIETIYGGKAEAYNSLRTIFEALSQTPADTRPGLNIAPLSSHLTLTSLVGWLEQPYSKDLPYLRLASILHDIGKLTSPTHHVAEGINFMEKVIDELKKENVKVDNIENALQRIKTHHSTDTIVSRADRVASSADRLIDEVREIAKEIEECKPFLSCYEEGARAECMEEIKYTVDQYKQCTVKIYEELMKKKREEEVKGEGVKGYLYYIDFPGVQSFINYFSNLRDLSAASFFVDYLSSTVPFIHLDNLLRKDKAFLPPEALLASMGGHSYLVGRTDVKPEDFIESLRSDEIFKELGVTPKVSYVGFYVGDRIIDYGSLGPLIRKSNLNSLVLADVKEDILSYGLHKVCDSCGIRPAVYSDQGSYYCSRCYFVHSHSASRGAMAKLSSKFYVDGKEWVYEKVEDPMEDIAEGGNYISVIKFDGNNAGEFFKRTLTFGEYTAKSFWVDYSVKKSYYVTLKEIGDKMIPVGTLYLGGDEGVIITPASVALPFVSKFIEEAKDSGLTFKVGVITAKYDHPIQFLINAADRLMEESKYEGGKESTVGVLTTSAFLSDKAVEEELEIHKEIYSPKVTLKELNSLLDVAKKLEERGILKHAVSKLDDALELYFTSKDMLRLIAYLVRERHRAESEDEKELFKLILSTYNDSGNEYINLLGYYHVLKTFILGERK